MNFDWINQIVPILTCGVDLFIKFGEWLISVVPTINAIGTSLIAYYTFRLTIFPKKLKFISWRLSSTAFCGDSIEITLENRSLCPAVVESIELLVDSHKIKFCECECIIEGFKTAKFQMQPYTKIVADGKTLDVDFLSLGNITLLVRTSRNVQYIRYKTISRFSHWLAHKKEEKLKQTTVCRNNFNGKLVVNDIKYAISFIEESETLQTVFIHKSGVMSESLFGYNALPKEVVANKENLKKHFDSEFQKIDLPYSIKEFEMLENDSDKKSE